jgi:hypothetical protein
MQVRSPHCRFGMVSSHAFMILCLLFFGSLARAQAPEVPPIGANKYDLLTQYLGTASKCRGVEACRRVSQAMARKSIQDARDAGIRFFRISTSGPVTGEDNDSLAIWRDRPEEFWRRTDQMMDDLDKYGVQIVPVLMWGGRKFALMTGESREELLTNPSSQSWKLLSRFVTEFVTRYRGRKTILFYELTNAFNNSADLDFEKRCAQRGDRPKCQVSGNFSTDQLIAFSGRFANLIRSVDPSRLISSGYAMPRLQAEHLRARPQWSPRGPDWTHDSREQFVKNLKDQHRHLDIISIHFYRGERNKRFGSSDVMDALVLAKRAADEAGKPLFVGEFGEPDAMNAQPGTHVSSTIQKVLELKIPYAAVWVWEFYQQSTFSTRHNRANEMNLEPGYTDFLINQIRKANVAAKPAMAAAPAGDDPPRVVLTWPLDCSSIGERPSTAFAVASDDSGKVDRVEFWLGANKLGAVTSPPYQIELPVGLAPGEHELKARAFDGSGKHAEFSSRVKVGGRTAAGGTCGAAR